MHKYITQYFTSDYDSHSEPDIAIDSGLVSVSKSDVRSTSTRPDTEASGLLCLTAKKLSLYFFRKNSTILY